MPDEHAVRNFPENFLEGIPRAIGTSIIHKNKTQIEPVSEMGDQALAERIGEVRENQLIETRDHHEIGIREEDAILGCNACKS